MKLFESFKLFHDFWIFSYMRENADQRRITPNTDTFYAVQIPLKLTGRTKVHRRLKYEL